MLAAKAGTISLLCVLWTLPQQKFRHRLNVMTDRPKTLEHWAYIDALRGWAALGVLTAHTGWFFPRLPWRAAQIYLFAGTGVQLFFMVSAITLITSWRKRSHLDSHPTTAFFIRRLFRIAPMFWVAAIAYVAASMVIVPIWRNGSVDLKSVILTLLFVHGWSPNTINSVVPGGWSIAIEMTFYLFFPVLVLMVTNVRRSVIFFALAVLIALIANFAAAHLYDSSSRTFEPFVYYWFPNQLPVFALGFVTLHLIPKFQHASRATAAGLTCVGFLFLLVGAFSGLPYSATVDHPAIWRDLAACAGFMPIILALSAKPWPFLVNRITRMLGKISFSSYLLQFAVIQVFLLVFGPTRSEGILAIAEWALALAGLLVINTLLARFTYRHVEKPWLLTGHLIASGQFSMTATAPASPLRPDNLAVRAFSPD